MVGVDDVTFLDHADGVIESRLPLRRDLGIESLRQHAAYLEHTGTDADAMLRRWAEEAGRRAGCRHAVAFEVVRP